MKIEDIEIHVGDLGRPYRVLGPLKATEKAVTAFANSPKVEQVNSKLREACAKLGGNAVINVTYERGITWTSWKALTARGTAVLAEPAGARESSPGPELLTYVRDNQGKYPIEAIVARMREAGHPDSAITAAIRVASGTPTSAEPTEEGRSARAIGVADELAKLAALRDQGVLSSDEFDDQKRRLLANL